MASPGVGGGQHHQLHQPIRRESLADSAYEQIRRAILQGELEDGAVLKQVELAREMAVSTVPVREALRRLQAEQLLVASPFQRYVVRALSNAQLAEYVDALEALEVAAVSRLIQEPDDVPGDRLAAAEALAEQLGDDLDEETWRELEVAFHTALDGTASIISEMAADIRQKLRRYTHAMDAAARERANREHRELLAAVVARDEEGSTAIVRRHIGESRSLLLDRDG
ncbi:MAG: GntR family transcriptional regulator [Solirubrobacteraceae bacterium]